MRTETLSREPRLDTPPPGSILFIRCVPAAAAEPALGWLRTRAPAATISALTSTSGRAALERTGVIDDVEIFDGRRIDVFTAGPFRILALARRRFDLVIVPYKDDRRSFGHVARFALAIRGRRAAWLDCSRPPDSGLSLADLDCVVRADTRPHGGSGSRVRKGALAALKWPALTAVFLVSLAALAVTAGVLLPFVWLKPEPADGDR